MDILSTQHELKLINSLHPFLLLDIKGSLMENGHCMWHGMYRTILLRRTL